MTYVETMNRDNGSLRTGSTHLAVGDFVEIEGEGRVRKVTYVMGSAGNYHACFRGQGAVPVGQVRWRRIDPTASQTTPLKVVKTKAATQIAPTTPAIKIEDLLRAPWPALDRVVLVTGFDSAWTAGNRGALVCVVVDSTGPRLHRTPTSCSFREAEQLLLAEEKALAPALHLLAVDQPLVVPNEAGRRPCERVVAHVVGRFGGGVQPANRQRADMFGPGAPIWSFLEKLGVKVQPEKLGLQAKGRRAIEVFPALALLGLFASIWDSGRMPKYNPERRTFALSDWKLVATLVGAAWSALGVTELADWCAQAAAHPSPKKALQDQLDACICALVGLIDWTSEGEGTVVVGDATQGYIVVPSHGALADTLKLDATREGVMFRRGKR